MTRQFVSRIYQNDSVPFNLQVKALSLSQNMYDVEINCKKKLNSVSNIVSDLKYKINHLLIKMSHFFEILFLKYCKTKDW